MKKQLKSMKLALMTGLLAILVTGVYAQSGNWDPYVHSVVISQAPLLPLEFIGTGVGSLKPGNNGGSVLTVGNPDGSNSNDLMVVTVSLANGVPNVADPSDAVQALTALGGPGVVYWDWTYTPSNKTFRGVQNRPIPAYTADEVTIQYKVTVNTFSSASPITFNGLNVNISPPGYTNPQTTDNDKASSYTYVEATDFGDAPGSYGVAMHNLDFTKDSSASPGPYYTKFFWLGSHIDVETNNSASVHAIGDDNTSTNGVYGVNQDDEDGVTFPVMMAGTTVSIPVSWTFAAGSKPTVSQRTWAYLTAWIDWNGDGVFDDSEGSTEVVSHTWDSENSEWLYKQRRRETTATPVNLSVTIPANAVVGQPIYARFRVSTVDKLTLTDIATDGEVEDYEITLEGQPVTIGDRVWTDANGNGVQDGGELGLTNVTVRLLDATNGVVATTVTDVNGNYLFANQPADTYRVEVVAPTQYLFTTRDAASATDLTDSDVNPATGRTDPVVMAAGTTNLTLDAGLYIPAVLFGNVFVDRNEDLLRNSGDASVTNTLVRLIVNGVEVARTNTVAHGYYRFENVPPGAVSVLVSRVSATLVAVPQSEPAASDVTRNRALPDVPGVDAFITYNVVSGYGVLASLPGEPLNFGFVDYPLATALDISVYASADGVMIDILTINESRKADIVVYAWLKNAWVEVGRVPAKKVHGEGSNRYSVLTTGLVAGTSYQFKIVDEAGHVHYSDGPMEVKAIRVEAMRMNMQTLQLTFSTEINRSYVVLVSTDLVNWSGEYVSYPTAFGWSEYSLEPFTAVEARTQVQVPVNGRQRAYFKIVRVDE